MRVHDFFKVTYVPRRTIRKAFKLTILPRRRTRLLFVFKWQIIVFGTLIAAKHNFPDKDLKNMPTIALKEI